MQTTLFSCKLHKKLQKDISPHTHILCWFNTYNLIQKMTKIWKGFRGIHILQGTVGFKILSTVDYLIFILTILCVFNDLTVYAKDGGLPANYAKATVKIKVLDVNDNAPVFGRLYYSIEVPENLDALPLFTLKATDPDAGDSGEISYRITGVTMYLITFLCFPHLLLFFYNLGWQYLTVIIKFCSLCSWGSIWKLPH